jgi:hypothetical protein
MEKLSMLTGNQSMLVKPWKGTSQFVSGDVTTVLGRFALVQNKSVLKSCRNRDVRIIGS